MPVPGLENAAPLDLRQARLTRLLSAGDGLVVVRGLPGSGRSSAVSAWLRTMPADAWIRYDASSEPGSTLPAATTTVVVSRLHADQELEWRPAIQQWLGQGLRVVLVPDGPISLAGIGLDRTLVDHQALAWDAATVRRLLDTRELEVTDDVVDEIVASTAGWAALVVAVAESWPIGAVVVEAGSGLRAASNTLRAELLPGIERLVDGALLQALVLEERPAVDLVAAALGRDVHAAVNELADLGLLRRSDHFGEQRVALVPLVRDVIRGATAETRPLHRRALDWALANERPGAALEHALAAEDTQRVSEVLDRWGIDLLLDERHALLPRALRSVLETTGTLPPGVGHLAEYLNLVPLGTTATPTADAADAGPRELERILRHGLIAIVGRRRRYRAEEAAELSRSLLPVAETLMLSQDPRDRQILPLWYLQHGISLVLDQEFVAGQEAFSRAWDLRPFDPFGFVGRAAASFAGAIQAIFGEPADARRWLDRADAEPSVPLRRAGWVHGPTAIARQVLAQDRMDFATSASFLGEGFNGDDEFWPFRLWVYFRHHVQVQDMASALALLEFAEKRYPPADRMTGLYRAGSSGVNAMALVMAGQANRARAHAEAAPDFVLNLNARARILLASGDAEGCHQLASKGLADLEWSPRGVLAMLSTLAAAELALDRPEEAWQRLSAAIELASRREMIGLMNDVPRDLLEAFAHEPIAAELLVVLDGTGLRASFPADLDVINLTEREQLVLGELATGESLERIARRLVVSVNTLKTQTKSLYRKLEVGNREAAVARAYSVGLLRP